VKVRDVMIRITLEDVYFSRSHVYTCGEFGWHACLGHVWICVSLGRVFRCNCGWRGRGGYTILRLLLLVLILVRIRNAGREVDPSRLFVVIPLLGGDVEGLKVYQLGLK
jgi:hypothetical protein